MLNMAASLPDRRLPIANPAGSRQKDAPVSSSSNRIEEHDEGRSGNVVTGPAHAPDMHREYARRQLQLWMRSGTTPQRVARRSAIVLLALDGVSSRTIAARLGVCSRTVTRWRQRFERDGCQGLLSDAPGRGRKPAISKDIVAAVRSAKAAAPSITMRELAAVFGVGVATVHRLLTRDDQD